MILEETFNMLNKRAHLRAPLSVSLDYLGAVEFDPGDQGLRHQYSSWCYNYLEGGRGVYYFEDGLHIVESGQGILIPPYTSHYLLNPGPEKLQLVYLCVNFGGNVRFAPGNGVASTDEIRRLDKSLQESYYTKSFNEMCHGLLRQLNGDKFSGNENILMEHQISLLGSFLKLFEYVQHKESPFATDEDTILLHDINNIIAHNFSRNLSLQELAQAVYISPRKLTAKFLELTGMSVKEYTQMLKMEQASHLLYTTSMSISEIADELGFCDIHYFSKRFKQHYGCPPNSLRNRHKKAQQ